MGQATAPAWRSSCDRLGANGVVMRVLASAAVTALVALAPVAPRAKRPNPFQASLFTSSWVLEPVA